MSYRYMRLLVFFDLPTLTDKNRRDYRQFRKYLVKNGFIMMQESVYCKLVPNITAADAMMDNIRKNSPSSGLLQVLRITEKQFGKIEFILGERKTEILDTDERLVIL